MKLPRDLMKWKHLWELGWRLELSKDRENKIVALSEGSKDTESITMDI